VIASHRLYASANCNKWTALLARYSLRANSTFATAYINDWLFADQQAGFGVSIKSGT